MLSEKLGKLVNTRRLSWGDTIFYTFVFLVHNRKWEKSGKCIASEEKREKNTGKEMVSDKVVVCQVVGSMCQLLGLPPSSPS